MVTPRRYDPSPAELAEACERIRRTWSPVEAERRRQGLVGNRKSRNAPRRRWTPPLIRITPHVAALLRVR
jgi:hypothetical protein